MLLVLFAKLFSFHFTCLYSSIKALSAKLLLQYMDLYMELNLVLPLRRRRKSLYLWFMMKILCVVLQVFGVWLFLGDLYQSLSYFLLFLYLCTSSSLVHIYVRLEKSTPFIRGSISSLFFTIYAETIDLTLNNLFLIDENE